jgi:hypothetical protein
LRRDFEQALRRREADAARGLIPVDDPDHHKDGRLAAAAGTFAALPTGQTLPLAVLMHEMAGEGWRM